MCRPAPRRASATPSCRQCRSEQRCRCAPFRTRSSPRGAALGLGTTAQANLVTNGGFETGDISGWSLVGGERPTKTSTDFVHSGTYAFREYDNFGFATLSQVITTVAGTSYDLSFWSALYVVHSGNILRYQVDAGPIGTAVQSLSYLQTTTSFVATAAATTIQFYIETDDGTGTWLLDDVSVEASSGSVPDSSSLIVFAIAALGLAGFRKTLRVRSA